MFRLLLVTSAMLASGPDDSTARRSLEDRDSYEASLSEVGRDADAHVRLALWCEAHGLEPERLKHLSLAVLNAPAHPMARGLLGLVAYRGRWQRPEAVADAVAADAARKALIGDYEARREVMAETAEAHWKMALWCEEVGLKPEATAHFWATVRLDPSREAARKRLGYKKQDGRWVTDAQLAREKEEAEAQKLADRRWRPLLEKYRDGLSAKAPSKQADAARRLAEINDPRAVPMVWAVFATGDETSQKVAVQVLGQIDVAGASRGLATLALFSNSAEVRRIATETLRRRDAREYAGLLISMLRDPVKYEVQKQVDGPGTTGSLFIEGERVNVQRRYNAPSAPNIRGPLVRSGDTLIFDEDGLPIVVRNSRLNGFATFNLQDGTYAMFGSGVRGMIPSPQQTPAFVQEMIRNPDQAATILSDNMGKGTNTPSVHMNAYRLIQRGFQTGNGRFSNTILLGRAILETQKAAATAQQQLMDDAATLDRYNEEVFESNKRVVQVLNSATEQDLPAESNPWRRWLTDQFGYAQRFSQEAKPTMVVEISPQLPPVAGFDTNRNGYARLSTSCFGVGTLVHTLTGTRPIETLRVGDEVLAQDTKTGALGYQPILVVHHNPPARTFRIDLGGESIVSSEFHRFWKAGHGWAMARELKVGDTLRTIGGLAKVDAVETGTVQPVFNLDVAVDGNFFVGRRGALVHDNTLPDLRLSPFDAAPSLVAAARP